MNASDFILVPRKSFLGRHPSLLNAASWVSERVGGRPILTREDFEFFDNLRYEDIRVPLNYQEIGRKAISVD
jgi:hypothetical protein